MANIKELKEVLEFIIPLAATIDKTSDDGFQWTEIFDFISPISKLPAAINDIDKIESELLDLDDAERQELYNVVEGLNFRSEGSEKITEEAINVSIGICKLIAVIRQYKD